MTVQELNALLKWFNEPNPTQGRVDKKRNCLKKLLDDGKAAPIFSPWTEREELELAWLKTEPISIQDTAIGRLQSIHEREIMATFKAMAKEEKAAFLKELQDDAVKEQEGAKDEQEALI